MFKTFLNPFFTLKIVALEFFYNIGVVEKDIKEHGEQNYTYYYLTKIGKGLLKSEKI